MDLNKLNFINKEESSSATPRRRHHAEQNSANYHRVSHNRTHHRTVSHGKSISSQPRSYRNVRLERGTADKLQAMQQVTGDSSFSNIIARMLKIVDPVILNNGFRKRKYRHDLRLIYKKAEILTELDHKM